MEKGSELVSKTNQLKMKVNDGKMRLTDTHNLIGLAQNKIISEVGGSVARNTKKDLEEKLGKKIIGKDNNLSIKYITDNK